MLSMKKIEKVTGGFRVTFVTGEGQETVQTYSKDKLMEMEGLLKQAIIHGTNEPVLVKEDPLEEDIRQKVDKIRLELITEVQDQIARIEQDYKTLSDTVSSAIGTKNTLWTQIHDETEKRLAILSKTLQETRILEQQALKHVVNGERRRNEVIGELKTKLNLRWEDTQRSSDDVKREIKDFEKFKKQLKSDLDVLKTKKKEVFDQLTNDTKELARKTEEKIKQSKEDVKDFMKVTSERIAKRNELRKKEEELKLKKEYIKTQVKLKEEYDLKKKKHVKDLIAKEAASLDKEIKSLKKKHAKMEVKAKKELAKEEAAKAEALKILEKDKADAEAAKLKVEAAAKKEKEAEIKDQVSRIDAAVAHVNVIIKQLDIKNTLAEAKKKVQGAIKKIREQIKNIRKKLKNIKK